MLCDSTQTRIRFRGTGRVLQITDKGPGEGGIRQVIEDHADLLSAAGWDVARLRLSSEAPQAETDRVHETVMPRPAARGRAEEEAAIRVLREWTRGADIVHLHLGFTAITPRFVAVAGRSAPLVVSLHDISPFQHRIGDCGQLGVLERLSRFRHVAGRSATWRAICDHAAAIHAPSQYLARLATEAGADPARVSVIPHMVPVPETDPADLADCDPAVVFAGLLSRPKGAHLLPAVFPALSATAARLIICGDGPLAPILAREAVRCGISDRVTMTGAVPRSDVLRHIAGARVVIHPSRIAEGFGLTVVEAMRLGRPVVGFGGGGTSEWLAHNVTGLVAESGTAEELARHVGTLLADHVQGTRLGEAGRARVLLDCAPDVVRDRLDALFARALRLSASHV